MNVLTNIELSNPGAHHLNLEIIVWWKILFPHFPGFPGIFSGYLLMKICVLFLFLVVNWGHCV